MALYAIGDIHGQLAALHRAMKLVEDDGGPDAAIVFMGDYTDRGPDSRGVIQYLIDGLAAGKPWICLKGNHDRLFSRFITQAVHHDARIVPGLSWLNPRLGGQMTLRSYGIAAQLAFDHPDGALEAVTAITLNGQALSLPQFARVVRDVVAPQHLAFLENRPLYHHHDGLFFVHAGIKPGVALQDQDVEDLLWIRGDFLDDPQSHGPLIVHGHTALDAPQFYGNRVNVDGGAGYGNPLVPVAFEGRACWTLTDRGRVSLCQ